MRINKRIEPALIPSGGGRRPEEARQPACPARQVPIPADDDPQDERGKRDPSTHVEVFLSPPPRPARATTATTRRVRERPRRQRAARVRGGARALGEDDLRAVVLNGNDVPQ